MARTEQSPAIVGERLRLAFELYAFGQAMMIARELPSASREMIEARVGQWLEERPGATHGDAEGRAGSWPPRRP